MKTKNLRVVATHKQATKNSRPKVSIVMPSTGGKSLTGPAHSIAKYMMNPSGSTPQRLATIEDGAPTSLLNLNLFQSVTVPQITGTYVDSGISSTSGIYQVFYFRSALRAMVSLTCNVPVFNYSAVFPGTTTIRNNVLIPPAANDSFDLVPLYLVSTLASQPHGPALYCGYDAEAGGKEGYIWMDYGCTLTVVQSTSTVADSVSFFAYDSGADKYVGSSNFSSSSVAFVLNSTVTNITAARGAYVRAVYICGSSPVVGQVATITLTSSLAQDVFSHAALPDSLNHLKQLVSMRINAESLLLKNCASDLNNNGYVQAASFDENADWRDYIGNKMLVNATSARNTFEGSLKRGLYSFLHVSGMHDLQFHNYVEFNSASSTPKNIGYPLNDCRFIAVTAVADSSTGNPGLNFFLHLTLGVEFSTSDQWWDATTGRVTIQQTNDALDIVRPSVQFYENPTHLAKLGRFLSGIGGSIRAHATKIGAALSMLFPGYAHAIGPIARVVAGL